MIYPVLTEFEWGMAGLLGIAVLIWGLRAIAKENQKPEPHDYAHDEEFQKDIEEESAKVHEYYNKVKADWEKQYGRSWDE